MKYFSLDPSFHFVFFFCHKGISLRESSRLTDIRYATLSKLANQKRQNINFRHIEENG
ncbi:helix-turn-helix domain-containing protein [Bacillus pseudomycoides]|uniref:helix-turn-helix domain-containing protein n=1 Tax=Bacillus pseudomycoides TaxID=64104 RepID=UPI00211D7C2D|nr:helix-turn-helix transcriptional regulator [Bacillus pseudomycoides]